MKMNETVAGLTITAKTEGVDQAKRQVDGLTQSTEQLGVVSEQTSKRVISLEDAWKRQTLRLDEAARAQANIARETKLADAALREGVATQEQHAQRLDQINQRYTTVSASTQKFTQQTGLARHELINLGRQAQDVGVSLVSGQSPLMVLAQQGSQIADVFISSGKSVGSFFSQAIGWAKTFFTSTAGIVTGIAGIGIAAVYAMSQFVRASTTVEQALENQNRLLKEGKALIDARTSAEARAQLVSKEQTQFETMRNMLDLQNKLNKAMEDAAKIAASRATTPTGGGMPEMGIAPSGFAPLKDPGLDKMTDAFVRLNAARDAGLPGLKEFNAELSKIGLEHPELAQVVEDMINAGRAGMDLEFATMRARALSDALKGSATDAQMAAVGLGSLAQFQLNNLQADQAREATERQAKAVLQMAEAYPGMSIEVAKQLNSLQGQLSVAQAVGATAQMEAQHRVTINQLLLEGKTLQEATAVADAQRAIALARIESAHQTAMVSLQGQLAVAQQITGLGQINAQYEANINNLKMQGFSLSQATAQADMQRAIALAQVETAAQQRLQTLQQEHEIITATSESEKGRIRARQEYDNLIKQGVSSGTAGSIAAQMQANARATQDATDATQSWSAANDDAVAAQLKMEDQIRRTTGAINRYNAAIFNSIFVHAPPLTYSSMGLFNPYVTGKDLWDLGGGNYTQFDPAGYTSQTTGAMTMTAITRQIYGEGGFDPQTGAPNAQGMEFQFNKMVAQAGGNIGSAVNTMLGGGVLTAGGLGAPPQVDQTKIGILSRGIDLLPKEQQIGSIQNLVGQLGAAPASLQTSELVKQLNDKLEQLTQATDANTSATSAMTDVLSPFYSSDPRRTHLGFRAFAGGGIMTQYGELPLKHYQGGGMATSPQVAVFGEGSTPEAYVPVPSGRIPVEIKQPANSNQRPVNVNIHVHGNADANTVAALKATAFQQAQTMRRVMR